MGCSVSTDSLRDETMRETNKSIPGLQPNVDSLNRQRSYARASFVEDGFGDGEGNSSSSSCRSSFSAEQAQDEVMTTPEVKRGRTRTISARSRAKHAAMGTRTRRDRSSSSSRACKQLFLSSSSESKRKWYGGQGGDDIDDPLGGTWSQGTEWDGGDYRGSSPSSMASARDYADLDDLCFSSETQSPVAIIEAVLDADPAAIKAIASMEDFTQVRARQRESSRSRSRG